MRNIIGLLLVFGVLVGTAGVITTAPQARFPAYCVALFLIWIIYQGRKGDGSKGKK